MCKRLGAMLAAACVGTWLAGGWLTGPYARYGAAVLGLLLIVYAILNLTTLQIVISRDHELWLGPIVGLPAGVILAGTGVFVPAIIYLQGIGLKKDELVQALGLSFTISTLALSITLIGARLLTVSQTGNILVALAGALVGMWFGQLVRLRLNQAAFRRCFLIALLLLGIYLSAGPMFAR